MIDGFPLPANSVRNMKIEILCTGDEILTGKTTNTNYSYMAQRLTEAGLQVHWGTTVGDDRDSLSRAFQQAAERADAVIVNGGLGPTVDDLSQELAAHAAGGVGTARAMACKTRSVLRKPRPGYATQQSQAGDVASGL